MSILATVRDALPARPSPRSPEGTAALGLEELLGHLDLAIDAAKALGVPTEEAEAIRTEAVRRLGFPADVYVLALVGGTGVGKSSLLNALAGAPISPASVRRPTTDQPVAWVPRESRADLDGLLAWLDVREIRDHDRGEQANVAILDLPDIDSLQAAHRERVEELLPRLDAVAWVTDPEKYHDAVLYDDFLHRWMRRLDRQAIILNKADRLAGDDLDRVRRDIERGLPRLGDPGRALVPVLAASALDGEGGTGEIRGWLAAEIEGKRVVRARLAATITATVEGLARAAGVEPVLGARPFLDPASRRSAIDEVVAAVLRVIDLPALEGQAVAATRARARARGTGPAGRLTSLIYRLSGRERRVANPDGFLVRWRERASLAPAVEVLRQAMTEPIRQAAPAIRPVLAASVEPAPLQKGLEAAVDRAIARQDRTVPSSRLWRVIGFLQTLATVAIALSVAWVIIWVLASPPVASVEVPLLGPVPMPFVAVVTSLLVGYLLARVLGLHAGWVGRRWARRLRGEVAAAVEREVGDHGFDTVDRLEAARRALWSAGRGVRQDRPRRS